MIILGKKYYFTDLELEQVREAFGHIETIDYRDKNPKNVIEKIDNLIKSRDYTTIVLNTRAKVDDAIVRYLTNLKYTIKDRTFKTIAIEHFLEEYLYKCYIPEDQNDLHFLDDITGFTWKQKTFKRMIDLGASAVLLFVYPLVRYIVNKKTQAESPGSLYFKQKRIGLNNQEFECIKFRSMHEHNADEDVRTAVQNDDRTFGWGAKMRRMRIDELPQIWNVFRGEMSLVGPRAEWNKLVEEYEKEIPYYNQRHVVPPGITGWAQVMFVEGRSKNDTRQKLMYDLYYIKHWSILLELKVIWKTIAVVLGERGI